jgi:hypothetical protein
MTWYSMPEHLRVYLQTPAELSQVLGLSLSAAVGSAHALQSLPGYRITIAWDLMLQSLVFA